MNGLDDLRGWTLGQHIQSHIDVYLSQSTFREVQRSFPYMVSKEFASGGGDVPEFVWHIIEDKVPFEIGDTGVEIIPFFVQHGRLFTTLEVPGYAPTPTYDPVATASAKLTYMSLNGSNTPKGTQKVEKTIQPYLCFGFKIQQEIVYMSDVSLIPDEAWPIIREQPEGGPLPVCVLDCLHLTPHTSHLGLKDAVETAREIGAQRTYFTGFSHAVSHDEYVTLTEAVGGAVKDEANLTDTEKRGLALIEEGKSIWVRPAHDGLRLWIEDGNVRDETSLNTACNHFLQLLLIPSGTFLMKVYAQTFLYDDPWPIVSLAYFLRYPNPLASHIVSCDVISRHQTPAGTLLTTRLILKRGSLPRWAPRGIISRAESWVIEESEVDPIGKVVHCTTKNLEFTKVMKMEESVLLQQTPDGKTLQTSEARVLSGFGWGLTKRIESHGVNRFKAHVQRSREGISLILNLLRESRLQPMTLGGTPAPFTAPVHEEEEKRTTNHHQKGPWSRLKSWFSPPKP
ncbi:hypothetical protein D9758_000013 [Tetrapyrgos nigripes]|uniref:PRELI/MSF1 domain-containing protein n=1 Tax=Tetrapyrgos nigripes TaxID=182062 RepID=A0A8H5LZB6_9AGAR|nr:hypothetical protein D9758_000013 [Tetrapyrgos nigripes]